ncbi:MAG: hypothetical protein DMG76_36640 [Acidobacteria bacterium]|nr:MAG: hypothetical protein DMG76_36640 [Acidobacteriota bacterium]
MAASSTRKISEEHCSLGASRALNSSKPVPTLSLCMARFGLFYPLFWQPVWNQQRGPIFGEPQSKFLGGVQSGKLHSTSILGGSLKTVGVPEPTALVLLGFGAFIGTFIHTTLRVRCAGI